MCKCLLKENALVGARKQRISLQEKGNKKDTYSETERDSYIMGKESSDILVLRGHMEGKRFQAEALVRYSKHLFKSDELA